MTGITVGTPTASGRSGGGKPPKVQAVPEDTNGDGNNVDPERKNNSDESADINAKYPDVAAIAKKLADAAFSWMSYPKPH